MRVELPETYNAAITFVDDNVTAGRGGKVAVYYGDKTLTYHDIQEGVNRAGNALRELGVELENRVVLVLLDCPEFVFSFFGAIKIGAVPVPVNPMVSSEDYGFLLQDSRAKVAIAQDQFLSRIGPASENARWLKNRVVVGDSVLGWLSFHVLLGKASPELQPAETSKDDVALWMYTSGSTGRPKGAVHLHHDFVQITDHFVRPILGITENDRMFSGSKLFFAYGLGNSLYFPFRFGASTVLCPEPMEARLAFDCIERYRPTVFFAVPTLYTKMLRLEGSFDLSSLRLCLSSGEPLPPPIFERWRDRFGLELLDVVGSTEALHDFLANRPGSAKPGSSGQVVPAFEAKVVDDEGKELPSGVVGHLMVKGESSSPYYWNRHEQTKKTMLGEWMRTGDMYMRDEEGFFWFSGRSDDMMKVGGMWVSPIEVENALISHPLVLEAAVVGFEDANGLTKPKAFVVLTERALATQELVVELQEFVRKVLAPYKYPRSIEFIKDLPKTVTGKIQRFRLRSQKER
jgi:benzoate-CoA ligase